MARKLRVQYEGAIYHVTVRGVDRRRLFDDDADRERFIDRLGAYVEDCRIRLYMFCLMNNHVHLLVETPQANLSAFMHKLQTAYTIYFNLRHNRAGHLMQGRFGSKLVEGNEYMLSLSRYIHLNSVYTENMEKQEYSIRRNHLRSYLWSSYRGYAGLAQPFEMMTEGPILSLMETQKKKERRAYLRFVEAGIAKADEEFLTVLRDSSWGIGGDDFQEHIRDLYANAVRQAKRLEDVSFRLHAQKTNPETIIRLVAEQYAMKPTDLGVRQYDCVARAVASYLLGKYAGLNQRDVGERIGMGSGSAVSRQLKRLGERRVTDNVLNQHIEQLEKKLKQKI